MYIELKENASKISRPKINAELAKKLRRVKRFVRLEAIAQEVIINAIFEVDSTALE